jgi:hypothetical protein
MEKEIAIRMEDVLHILYKTSSQLSLGLVKKIVVVQVQVQAQAVRASVLLAIMPKSLLDFLV